MALVTNWITKLPRLKNAKVKSAISGDGGVLRSGTVTRGKTLGINFIIRYM